MAGSAVSNSNVAVTAHPTVHTFETSYNADWKVDVYPAAGVTSVKLHRSLSGSTTTTFNRTYDTCGAGVGGRLWVRPCR